MIGQQNKNNRIATNYSQILELKNKKSRYLIFFSRILHFLHFEIKAPTKQLGKYEAIRATIK